MFDPRPTSFSGGWTICASLPRPRPPPSLLSRPLPRYCDVLLRRLAQVHGRDFSCDQVAGRALLGLEECTRGGSGIVTGERILAELG